MILTVLSFILGFILVIKGADFLIDGSTAIAKRYRISEMAIGLTIVAFGTSLPELVVNITASINNAPELAIGNIFGSSIANILLILGVTSILCPLPLRKKTVVSEIPFTLIATLLVGFLANASLFSSEKQMHISRIDALILFFFFGLYLIYIVKTARENMEELFSTEVKAMTMTKSFSFVLIGIVALYFGGDWLVKGAITIATALKISEGFIGLTIVAIGTSMPELVTSISAAKKGSIDISVGNIVGSNIFNLLWVLPISSMIRPLPFASINNIDILVMILGATLVIFSMATGVKNAIDKRNGIFFLIVYAIYLFFLFYRR